jgi:hypothetical protein
MRPPRAAVTATAFVAIGLELFCAGRILANGQLPRAAEHPHARGFSHAGKAALSRQLSDSVARGDTPGVVAEHTLGMSWAGIFNTEFWIDPVKPFGRGTWPAPGLRVKPAIRTAPSVEFIYPCEI